MCLGREFQKEGAATEKVRWLVLGGGSGALRQMSRGCGMGCDDGAGW